MSAQNGAPEATLNTAPPVSAAATAAASVRARIAATLQRGPSGSGAQVHSEGQRQRSIAAAAVDAAVPLGRTPSRKAGEAVRPAGKATAQSGKKRANEGGGGGGGGGAALKQARKARKAAAEEARNAADADDGDEQQDDALAQRTNTLSERERTATTKTIRCRRGQPGAPGILARRGPDGVELLPYAHQWDGVDACFRQKVMLLMYAAGLGKTAIVFLLQAALEQAKLDAQNKHIGGVKIVCVVPAGLVKNQWEETAHCWLKTRGRTATVNPLSIVTVQSAKDVTRELIDRVRVLIISKEVLTLLFKKCYKKVERGEQDAYNRWRTIWVRKAGVPLSPIFGRDTPINLVSGDEHARNGIAPEWDLLAIDEVHTVRNVNTVACAACAQLSLAARKRVGLTATPVFNGPKDMVGICKGLGFPAEFCSMPFWTGSGSDKRLDRNALAAFHKTYSDRRGEDTVQLPTLHAEFVDYPVQLPHHVAVPQISIKPPVKAKRPAGAAAVAAAAAAAADDDNDGTTDDDDDDDDDSDSDSGSGSTGGGGAGAAGGAGGGADVDDGEMSTAAARLLADLRRRFVAASYDDAGNRTDSVDVYAMYEGVRGDAEKLKIALARMENRDRNEARKQLIAKLTKMTQILVSPLLALYDAPTLHANPQVVDACAAVETGALMALRAQIAKHQANGHHRVIVASTYTTVLKVARRYIETRDPGIGRCLTYDGEVSHKDRQRIKDEFLGLPMPGGVLFLSIPAGGQGLHLVRDAPFGCTAIIFFEGRCYAPAAEKQCWKRIHRIGQTRECVRTHLVAHGSVGHAVGKIHVDKQGVSDAVTDGDMSHLDDGDGITWRKAGRIVDGCWELTDEGNFKAPPPRPGVGRLPMRPGSPQRRSHLPNSRTRRM